MCLGCYGFRGGGGGLVDGQGMYLLAKRLEHGQLPLAGGEGRVGTLSAAELSMLLEDLEEGEAERVAPGAISPSGERERHHPVPRPLPPLPREEILRHPGDACSEDGGTSLTRCEWCADLSQSPDYACHRS